MIEQVTHAIRGGQYSAPKTVLGFLGVIALIIASFASVAIITFASTSGLHWLVLPTLLFVGVGAVALVWAVLHLAREDPTPLVLGEITGDEFIANRKVTKGDSVSGEYVELAPARPGPPETIEELPNGEQGNAQELPPGEVDR